MSASSSGRRSSQRSARLRMLRVATSRRSMGTSVRGGDGNGKREYRAAALLGLDPDPATVALHDVAGDREPEAGAAPADPGPVGLVEALEDPALVDLRDADALVG